MASSNVNDLLPEALRKEIFHALVDAQDQKMSVSQSLRWVAERYGVSEEQIRQIESEGIDAEWPPL